MSSKDNQKIKDFAEDLLIAGFSVIPVTPAKTPPLGYEWTQYQSVSLGLDRVEEVFTGTWGVAIICGDVSEKTECIDLDPHGQDIEKIFQSYTNDVGVSTILEQHPFYIEQSPSGGYHILYKYDCRKCEKSQVMAHWENGETMIETRGEGAYIVVSPSPNYKSIRGDLCALPVITIEERDFLIEKAKGFNLKEEKASDGQPKTNHFDNTDPVSWYNWHKSSHAKQLLKDAGWKVKAKGKGKNRVEYWQRPDKDERDGHSATWGYKDNALYVFTSSDQTLKQECYYTPFQLLMKYQFKDDFNAAIEWVRSEMGDEYIVKLPLTNEPSVIPQSFPVNAFPQDFADIIRKAAEIYGTHIDYWSVSLLAVMSAAIGRRFLIQTERYTNSAALWFGIVGPTGNGKTTPTSIMLSEIKKFDKDSYKHYLAEKTDYESQMALPKKERGVLPPTPQCFQVLLSDFTPEAMADALDINKWGLAIYRDELMGWIKDIGRYNKSGEVESMLTIWSGEGTVLNRKKEIIRIDDPSLTIVGGIQPDLMKNLAAEGRGANGLMQRFCFAFPDKTERPQYSVIQHNAALFDPINKRIGSIVRNIPNKPTLIRLTDNANLEYIAFYNRNATLINNESSDYVRGIYAKLDIVVLRFALILCIMNEHSSVEASDLQSAIQITEYFRGSALKVNGLLFDNQQYSMDKKQVIMYLHKVQGKSQSEIGKIFGDTQPYICKVIAEHDKHGYTQNVH